MSLRPLRTDSNSFRCSAAALLICGLVTAPALAAGNGLTNGEFSNFTKDPWTEGWNTQYAPGMLLSSYDHANNLSSGSVRWTQPKSTLASSIFSEKEPVSGNQTFGVGGYFRYVNTAPAKASVQVQIRYFSDNACSVWLSTQKTGFFTLSGNWGLVSTNLTSPATAKCFQMQIDTQELFSFGGTPSAAYDILADGLYVNSGGGGTLPNLIFSNGFESGNMTGWTTN